MESTSVITTFITVFVLSYAWHMLGITVGYHRLLSHRSFKCNKLFEYFWVMGGYMALEGSPVWWATMHRAHHKYSDTPLDPHSPAQQGLFYAYYGWTMEGKYKDHIDPKTQAKDMLQDPIYRFLEQGGNWYKSFTLVVIINIAFRLALFAMFGWVVALANLLAGAICQHVPLLLNVVCHMPKQGYKNFETNDDSVNVPWVAMVTMGEGWHNNHHAFPGAARSGIKSWEWDPAFQTIRLGQKLGLVSWINESEKSPKYNPPVPASEPVKAALTEAEPAPVKDRSKPVGSGKELELSIK